MLAARGGGGGGGGGGCVAMVTKHGHAHVVLLDLTSEFEEFHGAADEALDCSGGHSREGELDPHGGVVVGLHASHEVALNPKHNGVDSRHANHGGGHSLVQGKKLRF